MVRKKNGSVPQKANSAFARAKIAEAALTFVPPFVRSALLDDESFCDEYGFVRDATLSLGESFSGKRSAILKAVRTVLATKTSATVQDSSGTSWTIRHVSKKGSLPTLQIGDGTSTLIVPDLNVLSSVKKDRLRALFEATEHVGLPSNAENAWRQVLALRPLTDDELDTYFSDIRNTPGHFKSVLQVEMRSGSSSIDSLVPVSRIYYERLIGQWNGEKDIQEYAASRTKRLRNSAVPLGPKQLLCELHLSSHSSLLSDVVDNGLKGDVLEQAIKGIASNGDRISQIGSIEIGLRLVTTNRQLIPVISSQIRTLRDDDPRANNSGYRLLSALFMLVDGELARTRIFADTPPYYRRLAALSQSSLIQREIMNGPVDMGHFADWAFRGRGGFFYLQSLIDMRLEPRWNPDFADPSYMKEDLLSRVLNAARENEESLEGSELHELVLGSSPDSIVSTIRPLVAFLPGPLEANATSANRLPDDMAKVVEDQIKIENVGPTSFIALANSALLFQITSSHADLAANALKLGQHRLSNVESKEQLHAILYGLATAAAVSRSASLADETRILLRRYLHEPQYKISVEEAFRLGLIAAASREDVREWANFIGDWATELSLGDLSPDDGKSLQYHLDILRHLSSELRFTCGRADAALQGFNRIAA